MSFGVTKERVNSEDFAAVGIFLGAKQDNRLALEKLDTPLSFY
jgi:hypothetical protein